MPQRTFPHLAGLIRNIEKTAAEEPDPLGILVLMLRMVIDSHADPYLLIGALVEGTAATVARKIPPERQGDVALETVKILMDRMKRLQ
jgi:hypothetical protein